MYALVAPLVESTLLESIDVNRTRKKKRLTTTGRLPYILSALQQEGLTINGFFSG
jgi:hypothetical protein